MSLTRAVARALALTCAVASLAVLAGPARAAEPFEVTGTIRTDDGGSLAGTSLLVRLYSIDTGGASYPTPQDSTLLIGETGSTLTYSLEAPVPGYYAVSVQPVRAGSGQPRYVQTWFGGGDQAPSRNDDPGLLFMDESGTALEGIDVAVRAGAVVSGTVRGSDGGAAGDVTVTPKKVAADGSLSDLPYATNGLSADDGSWATTILAGTRLALVATRRGYASSTVDLGTVPAGGLTRDLALTPDWSGLRADGPTVRDETCLRRSVGGKTTLGGTTFGVDSGGFVTVGGDPDWDEGEPVAAGVASLMPYYVDGGRDDGSVARRLTWGADATHLCVLWDDPTEGTTFQAVATPRADGTIDVAYNYDRIGANLYVGQPVAGWYDAAGAAVIEKPSTTGSAGSARVPGRYRITFLTALPAPMATEPAVSGTPVAGTTLAATADPTSSYAWRVGSRTVTGATLPLTVSDVGRNVSLTVTTPRTSGPAATWYRRVGTVRAGALTDLVVTASGPDDEPVTPASVSACAVDTGVCLLGDGTFRAQAVPGTTYAIRVVPTADSGLREAAATATVPASGASVTVPLRAPLAPPANVEGLEDQHVYWDDTRTVTVTGCAGVVDPAYEVAFTDGTAPRTGAMTADGDTYALELTDLEPSRGWASVTTNVPADCDGDATSFDVYVDPYSETVDQYGRPVPGARLTLLRADDEAGPYAVVESYVAGAEGHFGWAPEVDGWYSILATAGGCTTTTTTPVQVTGTPMNVLVRMVCEDAPAPTLSDASVRSLRVAGSDRSAVVGTTISASAPTWPGFAAGPLEWLRDGTVVGTGSTYTVRPADLGRLSVRMTGLRRDFVPDPDRGSVVSFEPASGTTSVPVGTGPATRITSGPTVVGQLVPGRVLGVGGTSWADGGPTTSYEWLRDGTPVATGPTYTVRATDVRHLLSVRVDAARDGYATASATSPEVAVPKVGTFVAVTRRGRVLRVLVGSDGVVPDGRVVVYDRGRLLRRASLTDGRVRVRLKPGKHRIRVVYLGGATTDSSRSRMVRLRVR